MTSMLDGIRNLITPTLLSRVSAQTGEPEAAISKAFAAVLPSILTAAANRVDEPGFMSHLAGMALGSAHETNVLPRAENIVSARSAADSSAGWLANLFAGNLTGTADAVARFAGIRGTSAISLLSIASPLLIGYLGRMMRTENLDAAGLADRLRRERRSVWAALPAGFDAPAFPRTPVETVRHVADAARRIDIPAKLPDRDERAPAGWVMPLLLTALAVGALLWWGARDRTVRVPGAGDAAASAVGTAGSTVRMLVRTLPGNVNLRVPSGGMEDRLVDHLGSRSTGLPGGQDGWFAFDRIAFETGSASLTAESREQLANVSQILRAYPNARATIAGFTDNVGDEAANVALSRSRAIAVANALQASGVDTSRLQTEGFGSRNPVADNSTEEGRAQNRRVALQVNALG